MKQRCKKEYIKGHHPVHSYSVSFSYGWARTRTHTTKGPMCLTSHPATRTCHANTESLSVVTAYRSADLPRLEILFWDATGTVLFLITLPNISDALSYLNLGSIEQNFRVLELRIQKNEEMST